MAAPVDTDHLVQGVVKWLQGFSDVLEVLGATTVSHVPYLFQTNLWVTMEGSQSTAAVFSRAGGWAGPNLHNTMRFPRIQLEIFADPLRDTGNRVTDPGEVERRIDAVHKIIDRHLHRPQNGVQWWGSVRTIGCTRLAEPTVYPVPEGGGLQRLQAFYGVIEG